MEGRKGRRRRKEELGRGRGGEAERGKEGKERGDLPDQCQTTSYAPVSLLPIRMHTYLLEWSYSTRTTMK